MTGRTSNNDPYRNYDPYQSNTSNQDTNSNALIVREQSDHKTNQVSTQVIQGGGGYQVGPFGGNNSMVQGFGRNPASSGQVQVDHVEARFNGLAVLDNKAFFRLLQLMQNDIPRRIEAAKTAYVANFKAAISNKDWRAIDRLKQELYQEIGEAGNAVLESLIDDFVKALKDACSGGVRNSVIDEIYEALKNTGIFCSVCEKTAAACCSGYGNRDLSLGLVNLLSKDKTTDNLQMVEARSRVIGTLLNSNASIDDFLYSGPVFFLSHEANQFNYPSYRTHRTAYISYFTRARDMEAFRVVDNIPKHYPLPSDAKTYFTQKKAEDHRISGSIRSHLEKCQDSPLKTELLQMYK